MATRMDYQEMKRLRDLGFSLARIAAVMGCDDTTVSKAVKRFGWDKKPHGKPKHVDAAKLFQLWHSDMDTGDIALELGVSTSTLHSLRLRHKLPKRKRHATLMADPTPDQIEERARQCRERHFAERRGETDETTLQWRRGGVA